ncbi:MAG TPA: S26 family signal peptidase [Caulobacteraceae bacterium]|nr:S26 family signal peptidase [Caulobacteraceae bacterium]
MGLAAALAVLLAVGSVGPPQLLFNHTASEPFGFYWRTGAGPSVGALVAFMAPPAALPYADAHLPALRREPILKTIAAGPGDRVCADGRSLAINGVVRGRIADRDGAGRALPHWAGCRTLRPGELFVFSARVPNSFDSRYFGPIPTRAVLGVYTRLGAS